MRFEWDPKKAAINHEKHKVRFVDAITAFDDPYALIAPDHDHSTLNEFRQWLIGEADTGVLVIIFTIRQPDDVYRIISARPANRKERRQYVESKKLSV
jgi:uncharacterized DUF497 family protein